MEINKCVLCDSYKPLPIHVTELENGKAKESYSLCQECAKIYLDDTKKTPHPKKIALKSDSLDLTYIETPEELLDFIMNHESKVMNKECSNCGLTLIEFDAFGRYGCPDCYRAFSTETKTICKKYHHKMHHIGKKPKSKSQSKKERINLLKLQLAKSIELEQYEKASQIKKEIKQISDEIL